MDDWFWSYWYYHLPNYVMAALMYTLLARFFMQFFVPREWPNYIWRWFLRTTNWAVASVQVVTPRYMPWPLLPLFAALWLFFLRIALLLLLAQYGLAPRLE